MAIFSLSVKSLNRKSGKSAVAAAAYRSCEKLTDERDNQTYDFRKKQSLADPADSFIIAPDGADWAQDRNALWNAAEAAENRGNSTTAREWLAALPAELNPDEQRQLVQQFANELVERFGVAADVSIHEPSRDGDERNRHAHILTTTRTVEPDGLGKKTRELDVKTTASHAVEEMRQRWAELANAALETAGQRERIDHRSYERQGLDKEPTVHLGPKATKAKRAGLQHPRLERAEREQQAGRIRQRRKRAQKAAQQRPREQISRDDPIIRKARAKKIHARASRPLSPAPEAPPLISPAGAIERKLRGLGADEPFSDTIAQSFYLGLTECAKRPLAGVRKDDLGNVLIDCKKAAADLITRSHQAILWIFEKLETLQKKRDLSRKPQQQTRRPQRGRDDFGM